MRRRAILAVLATCAGALPARAVTLDADYALSSHGFHLLDVDTHTQLTTAGYAITAHSRTVGLIGVLAHSDVTSVASGRFDGIHVLPDRYASSGRSRGADRRPDETSRKRHGRRHGEAEEHQPRRHAVRPR